MSRCLTLVCLLLAACGGDKAFHHDEDFAPDKRHRHDYTASIATACEAARHVMIGQGYVVARSDEASETVMFGQKDFKEKEKRHAILQMQVVCGSATKGSTLYVAAVESHFDVAKNESSTYVGVPMVAPISFGSASSSQAQLKLSGESIDDKDFYADFFKAVERELSRR